MPNAQPDTPPAPTTFSRYRFGAARFIIVSAPAAEPPPWVARLTPSEHAVLMLLGRGMSNMEIAAARGSSVPTVAKQVSALKQKTGCRERVALSTMGRRFQTSATGGVSPHCAPKELGAWAGLRAHASRQISLTRRPQDEDGAALWRAVLDGHWSLVDELDSGGVRLFVLRENDVRVASRGLTRGERLVLPLMLSGCPNKIVAWDLGIAPSTVSLRARSILGKTGAPDRAALVLLAETLHAAVRP